MSGSYCSEWMVVNNSVAEDGEEPDKESENASTLDESVHVGDLMQRLQLEEDKNLNLNQQNETLKIQNDQLEMINSTLVDENHSLKYSPSLAISQDSLATISDCEEEFLDFDYQLGLGVECRRKRRDPENSRCTYCTTIVPQADHYFYYEYGRNKTKKQCKEVILQSLFCDSKFVIYLAECIKCKLQYVGSTTNFLQRLSKYKRNIVERIGDTRFENHMRKCHEKTDNPLSMVTITPIRQYDPQRHNRDTLRAHENLWMQRLKTLDHGLNKRVEKGTCNCIDYEREKDNIARTVIIESDNEADSVGPRRENPTRKCKKC